MAENKKSFILYADLIHTFNELSDEEAGKLIKHIFSYVNDLEPEINDRLLKIAFEPIKQQLKRDLKRWENFREKQSYNGKKGGRPAKANTETENPENPKNPSLSDESQKSLNVTVNVNDNVNANVIESTGAHALENSNLFRKPSIPTSQQVHEAFVRLGGTQEMAQKFYEKHSSVEWFLNGSPIKNFAALIPSFIDNWKKNEANGNTIKRTDTANPQSGILRTAC
jgi:hypothetical protein